MCFKTTHGDIACQNCPRIFPRLSERADCNSMNCPVPIEVRNAVFSSPAPMAQVKSETLGCNLFLEMLLGEDEVPQQKAS
jgi:hypothetical protein